MSSLMVGTATATPGTRARGVIPVTTLPGRRLLEIPVVVINGIEPGLCDLLAELRAPVDGMIFGLRALPGVQTGDWCCFYAEIQRELGRVL